MPPLSLPKNRSTGNLVRTAQSVDRNRSRYRMSLDAATAAAAAAAAADYESIRSVTLKLLHATAGKGAEPTLGAVFC